MRILLDTHIFLWCLKDDKRLTKAAKSKILNANEVYISAASIWEISIKIKLNKLEADIDELVESIPASGFLELPISAQHAAGVIHLPDIHRDPFDRLLISQALYEPLAFFTADAVLKKYSELVEIV